MQEGQRTFLCKGSRAVAGERGESLDRGWNNGRGDTPPPCRVCLRLAGCGCVGVHVQGWNKGSMACGDRAGMEEGVNVPMVTLVKDGRYGDGRVPHELNEEEGTRVLMVKLAEFGSWDYF